MTGPKLMPLIDEGYMEIALAKDIVRGKSLSKIHDHLRTIEGLLKTNPEAGVRLLGSWFSPNESLAKLVADTGWTAGGSR